MFTDHFYHSTIKRAISVFGSLFNNISIVKKDPTGSVTNISRVPLAYGPKQKWLARVDQQPDPDGNKVAIKLPRMSFEMLGMTYDPSMKINKNNMIFVAGADGNSKKSVRTFSPYRLNFQLSIIAKNQDDALQVVEQILPYFQPDYTVTVKEIESMDILSDMPITLLAINSTEDYEGDFVTRRAIIYTLDFEIRVRFYGPTTDRKIIKHVIVDFFNKTNNQPLEKLEVSVDPLSAEESDTHNIIEAITFLTDTDAFYVTVEAGNDEYTIGELVIGQTSGFSGKVISFINNKLLLHSVDGQLAVAENLVGSTSSTSRVISVVAPVYSTA